MFSSFFLVALSKGQIAPDFSAKNQSGKMVNLKDFRGKPVVLFFYPKDETPGCTKEACSFRDQFSKLKDLGAVVFGISKQDEKSHRAFIQNHKLPFDLLVDDGSISKAYGIPEIPLTGILMRRSALIDAQGKIARVYESVDPTTHVEEVIQDIKTLIN